MYLVKDILVLRSPIFYIICKWVSRIPDAFWLLSYRCRIRSPKDVSSYNNNSPVKANIFRYSNQKVWLKITKVYQLHIIGIYISRATAKEDKKILSDYKILLAHGLLNKKESTKISFFIIKNQANIIHTKFTVRLDCFKWNFKLFQQDLPRLK